MFNLFEFVIGYMECEDNLRSYLWAFRDGDVSGFNEPMDINDSVSLLLSHWLRSRKDLEIGLFIDNICCERLARDVVRNSGLFDVHVSSVNHVLSDEGYPEITDISFVEKGDIFDCKPYEYRTVITNPVFENS